MKKAIQEKNGAWVYANAARLDEIRRSGIKIDEILYLDHFHITLVTPRFLMKKTRGEVVEKMALFKASAG